MTKNLQPSLIHHNLSDDNRKGNEEVSREGKTVIKFLLLKQLLLWATG